MKKATYAEVLQFIADYSGSVTAIDVAHRFPVESRTYGRQQYTNTLIARARRDGFVEDCVRCPHCQKAQTRGKKNVPLFVTEAGRSYLLSA